MAFYGRIVNGWQGMLLLSTRPEHTTKIVQDCCNENLTDFSTKMNRLFVFSPLYYFEWNYMLCKLKEYNFSSSMHFIDVLGKCEMKYPWMQSW